MMLIFDKIIKETLAKSYICGGYRLIPPGEKFCHFVWNLSYPGNKIIKGDGFLIHHKDGNKLNDDRKNLEKIKLSEHVSIHKKGNNYFKDRCHSQEAIEKMSGENNSMYGIYRFGESNPMYRKKHSLKSRELMSKSKKGENNYWYGKHHSDVAKEKMSESHKRENLSPGTIKKMREAKYKYFEKLKENYQIV